MLGVKETLKYLIYDKLKQATGKIMFPVAKPHDQITS